MRTTFVPIMWNKVQPRDRIVQRMKSGCHFLCQIFLEEILYCTAFTLIIKKGKSGIGYGMIIGNDLMLQLGLLVDFKHEVLQ